MSRTKDFEHRFVANAPRELEPGVLYISIEFATALHQCACGCGSRIVTPFSPTDWRMSFDGRSVSLNPSIGNWSLPCRSHYFIRRGTVQWAGDWSEQMVLQNRASDRSRKRPLEQASSVNNIESPAYRSHGSWFKRMQRWFLSKL